MFAVSIFDKFFKYLYSLYFTNIYFNTIIDIQIENNFEASQNGFITNKVYS